MNSTTQTMHSHARGISSLKWAASGSIMEALVAIAMIALAVVGLAGVYSLTMAATATIIAAAAILLEGGAFSSAQNATQGNVGHMGGVSAEMLGAVAGVLLGILALMGVAPVTLLSVAILIFGVTFLLSGSASEHPLFAGRMDGHLFLGLSVAVLGLLAVIGISPVTLVLVGLLVLGVASLFAGSSKGLRTMQQPGCSS